MAARSIASAFVFGVALVAASITLWLAAIATLPDAHTILIAAVFAALMAAATARQIHFGFRANVDLSTLLIIAMVLSFEPEIAVLATAAGVLTGHLIQRAPWSGALFNSGQVVLQAAAGAGLLALAGWNPDGPAYGDLRFLPAIVLVMVAVFLVNTALVSSVIGLQARIAPWLVWREAVTTDLLIEQASQFALGLVTAIVMHVQIWLLPVLMAPGLMLYVSASRKSNLEFQTLEAINALADLVDQRDPYTADHSRRVAVIARELATSIGMGPHDIIAVERAGRVHDLGKLVIDLGVLNKDEPLSDQEWEQFRRHPGDGANILTWFPEFREATTFVRHHHERWDGQGYPDGLEGNEIPLGARVLAVADALDAMSTARPYRPALTSAAILAEFERFRGRQWDATVVDALFRLVERGTIALPGAGDAPVVYDGLGSVVHSR
jgi:HD-GYP domain-containing protein (c-di-GMP phosphodiesterase class II)